MAYWAIRILVRQPAVPVVAPRQMTPFEDLHHRVLGRGGLAAAGRSSSTTRCRSAVDEVGVRQRLAEPRLPEDGHEVVVDRGRVQ